MPEQEFHGIIRKPGEPAPGRQCRTCSSFEPGSALVLGVKGSGSCHANPPTVLLQGGKLSSLFPPVLETSWCGLYTPAV